MNFTLLMDADSVTAIVLAIHEDPQIRDGWRDSITNDMHEKSTWTLDNDQTNHHGNSSGY